MDRRRAAGALLALAVCVASSAAAPTSSNDTALETYDGSSEGCYYNFQSYGEGDRIMTNEPCLNCTCHNRMLMCYLRVCPFTKPIGQDCTVEKRADQCCPIVTCPDVPVDLLTSTSTSSPAEYGGTGLGRVDKYGCDINGKYFPEGAKVPPSPNKPCEHCYCIRNMTTCVMQECTLHVEGCTPIYNKDVCCPVRYSCDHPEDETLMLDDMTTTVRPTPGFLLTTTTLAPVTQSSQECLHNEAVFPDGALIKTEKACEHCYCMKGDIVCVVQQCGTPMENEGKNCTSIAPKEGQCCPDTYICEGDDLSTELVHELTTVPYLKEETTSPPRRVAVEGSGYRNEDELPYTEIPMFGTESEGSGEEPAMETVTKSEVTEKEPPELIDEGFMMTDTPHKFSPIPTEQVITKEEDKTTTEPDKGLNTVPDVLPEEEHTMSTSTEKPIKPEYEHSDTTMASITTSYNNKETKPADTSSETSAHTFDITTETLQESVTNKADTTLAEEPKITTVLSEKVTELPKLTTLAPELVTDISKMTTVPVTSSEEVSKTTISSELVTDVPKTADQVTEVPKVITASPEQMTDVPKLTTVLSDQATEIPELMTNPSDQSIDLPKSTTVLPEQMTDVPQITTQADIITTASEVTATTSKIEKATTTSETTTINLGDNEIGEDTTAYPTPGRIPGEGDCLLDGVTYHNESTVLSSNKCHAGCKCISSIIKCEPLICSPPPDYMEHCQSVYDSPEACCPTYVCDHPKETVPPESHNQMFGTESPVPPPKECSDSECKVSVKEPCTSEACDNTQTGHKPETLDRDDTQTAKIPDVSECGPDGCDTSRVSTTPSTQESMKPCLGENCAIVPSEKLPESPTECHGEECKKPEQNKCDKIDGCKSPEIDVITQECTGNDCRRIGTSDTDKKDSTDCAETECTAQKIDSELDKKPELSTESDTLNELTTVKQQSVSEMTSSEQPQILDMTTVTHAEETNEQTTKVETSSEQSVNNKEETPSITETIVSTKDEEKSTQEPQSEPSVTTEASVKDSENSMTPTIELLTTKADKFTTESVIKETTKAADEVPESTKAPDELVTEISDKESSTEPQTIVPIMTETKFEDTTPKLIEKTPTEEPQEATTEPSKASDTTPVQTQENEIKPEIQSSSTYQPDYDQSTKIPLKCEGDACKVPPTVQEPEKCDPSTDCKVLEPNVTQDKSTELPTKCEGSECAAMATSPTPIIPDEKCDGNEGCKLPESHVKEHEKSTEEPAKCDSIECLQSGDLPVQPVVSQEDKCDSNEGCKPVDGTIQPSCSGNNCDSNTISPDILSSEKVETKPELEATTEKESKSPEMQTAAPFTNAPVTEGTMIVTPNAEKEITLGVTEGFETTKAPLKEDVTEGVPTVTEMQDTTDSGILRETGTQTERDNTDSETTKYAIQTLATTTAPHVAETQGPSSDKPDYHDTEPEKSTEESVTDQPSSERLSTLLPEVVSEQEKATTMLPIVVLKEESTETQQSITENVPPQTTEKTEGPVKSDTEGTETEKEDSTDTPIVIPVDVQTKEPEMGTPEIEQVTQHDKDIPTSDITETPETRLPSTEIVPELQTHSSSESLNDFTKLPVQTTEGSLLTQELMTTSPEKVTSEIALETKKPDIMEEIDTTTKLIERTETSSESTDKPEYSHSPNEENKPDATPKIPEDKIMDSHTEPTVIATSTREEEQTQHETTTLAAKQVTAADEATETYSEATEKDQKSPKPIATESQVLMTEPTKLSDFEIQSTENPEKVPIEKEPSATTLVPEPVEKEQTETSPALKPAENEPVATTLASKPVESETSTTTVTSELAVKETSATTLLSEPEEKEPSTTTQASVTVEKEQSATTLSSESVDKEPSVTTDASKLTEKEAGETTVASESVEKGSSTTTMASEPIEKEPSATTLASESTDKEPSAITLASEPSATTLASEPSATTIAPESIEKEPSVTTVIPERTDKDPSPTEATEKEPSATTLASEPVEKEQSASTPALDIEDKEPIATTLATEPVEKEPSVTTVIPERTEKEPSPTEPTEKEPSATTLASEPDEKEQSVSTPEPADKEPNATTLASEPVEKESSGTTPISEFIEKEPVVTTSPSTLKEESSATSPVSEADIKKPETTMATEMVQKESSTTPDTSEPDSETIATTMSSKVDQQEPSEITTASKPTGIEPSTTSVSPLSEEPNKINESSEPEDTKTTTMASEPVEIVTPESVLPDKESSVTTTAPESGVKEITTTTPVFEDKAPESDSIVTKSPELESPPATTPKTKDETQPDVVSHEQPETTTPVHDRVSSDTTETSETTPDQVELELHTHKPEESSTMFPELSSSETPETTVVEKESSPELEDGRRTDVPEQTTLKINMMPETQTEKEPVNVQHQPETPIIETTPAATDEISESDVRYGDDQSSTISPIPVTTVAEEKIVTTSGTVSSQSPVEPEPATSTQRPNVITEEEFIPVTSTKTPTTTEKAEEEPLQTTPAIDKFTKTEDKPEIDSAELPKPVEMPTDDVSPPEEFPPSGGYGQEPDYVEEDQSFGPGTCRYGGKVYVSAQQIPRDDPCDFCFCFRSDIICLQQSCPPPIHGCHEEPISGFCCPRYECPVSMATTLNVTTTTTTTTTTLPPHFFPHAYKGAAQRKGCVIKGQTYKVGDVVRASSGPCLHCTCGGDGQMKCDPKACTPEPMLRQMIAAAVSARRRR